MCSICLEDLAMNSDNIVLTCKHVFHTDCFKSWSEGSRGKIVLCPNCRAHIRKPFSCSDLWDSIRTVLNDDKNVGVTMLVIILIIYISITIMQVFIITAACLSYVSRSIDKLYT